MCSGSSPPTFAPTPVAILMHAARALSLKKGSYESKCNKAGTSIIFKSLLLSVLKISKVD